MELKQISYFLALAEELHFWHTAEKMFITQSALSRQIKALEEELGVQLFERSKRKVQLTEAGLFLRDRWLPLLDEISRLHRQARKIHQGEQGSLTIGYPGSIAWGFLPELISSIAQALPELRVELVEPTDISFEQLLLSYQMDLAFRRDPAINPALQSICLYSEPFSLVVPQGHWLTEEAFRGLQDVKDERFILSGLHHTTFYVSSLRQLFQEAHFSPNVYIESDFGSMILSLVARGLGVTVLPSSYAYGIWPQLRFIKLPQQVSLYAVWRKEDSSSVIRNVIAQVLQVAKRFAAEPL
ncbi:LysR family transcriptional regulator [Cesiribacter andamanensis]|uniref:Cat operon transcriptional regulator n=1 Tax=Cesiribacter andamanensis AMV16 TaxID=1279009 RepID=M7NB13_9BACT|nr:LysR family transcriptional regulator [Cesiribacter andamanensis]EMR04376.1 Cat operon transcriptional regulator [Cesiribacter andamanensis AMV16]